MASRFRLTLRDVPPQHNQTPAASESGQARRPFLQHVGKSPIAVSLLVASVYMVWLITVGLTGHQPRDFIRIGSRFIHNSTVSSVIKPDPRYHYATRSDGYDGQFYYFIAADPQNARYYVDLQIYRYTRILYPMLARTLAAGQINLIPYMLILINVLALIGGAFVVGLWLARHSISPWFAIVYGLYPGLFASLQRDVPEPLAFSLVAVAVYLYSFGGKHRLLWSAAVFALATLTRETTADFAGIYGLAILVDGYSSSTTLLASERPVKSAASQLLRRAKRNSPRTVTFFLVSFLPILAYKLFLAVWIGSALGTQQAHYPTLIPLSGLFGYWPWTVFQWEEVIGVVIPALICAALGAWTLWKSQSRVEVWVLLANVLLFVLTLNHLSYANLADSGRIAAGVVLAAIFCLPTFDLATNVNRSWFWLCSFFWLVLFPPLFPFVSG
jgi:hypothetical protein